MWWAVPSDVQFQAAAERWGRMLLGEPLVVGCFRSCVGAAACVPALFQDFLEGPDTWSKCPCSCCSQWSRTKVAGLRPISYCLGSSVPHSSKTELLPDFLWSVLSLESGTTCMCIRVTFRLLMSKWIWTECGKKNKETTFLYQGKWSQS